MNRWTLAVLATLAALAGYLLLRPAPATRVTALFDRTVGLYPGSDVRVLGVKVGEVEAVVPEGSRVRVRMAVQAKVPARVQAVLVSRSVVADRFVQLAPPYTTGPSLADGATITDTRVPVEIDEAMASFDELAVALGPRGANREGALAELLRISARTFDGQGGKIADTVEGLGAAAEVLAGNRDEVAGTVRDLATVTSGLAEDDAAVRRFLDGVAEVTGHLHDDREQLRAVLRTLSGTLTQVAHFVEDNRDEVAAGTRDLARLSKLLDEHRAALATFLDTAPAALNNAANAYDAQSGTFRARLDLNGQTDDLGLWLCSLTHSMGVPPERCEPLLDETLGGLVPRVPRD
ncbi:MCE family protein [Nonomuraea sp. NPDC050328]|uniref:MCE family protein n=1 Tax=Nonomuraea sp. NPDC050328 TaxID=3364361 RepID=UPI0037B013DD